MKALRNARVHTSTINMIMLSFESKQQVITNHRAQAKNQAVRCASSNCGQTYQVHNSTFKLIPKKLNRGPDNSDIINWNKSYDEWHTPKLDGILGGDKKKNYYSFMDNMFVHWMQCHAVEPLPTALEGYFEKYGQFRKTSFANGPLANWEETKKVLKWSNEFNPFDNMQVSFV